MDGAALHIIDMLLAVVRQLHVAEIFSARGEDLEAYIFADDVLRVRSAVLFIRDVDLAEESLGIRIGVGPGLLQRKVGRIHRAPFGQKRERTQHSRNKTKQSSPNKHRYTR